MDLSINRKNRYLTSNSMIGVYTRTDKQRSKNSVHKRLTWLDIAKGIGLIGTGTILFTGGTCRYSF